MEVLNKDWNRDEIYTVFGRLENGILSNEEGIFRAMSYRSFKRIYDGTEGFFNLKYSPDVGAWVIFQALEV